MGIVPERALDTTALTSVHAPLTLIFMPPDSPRLLILETSGRPVVVAVALGADLEAVRSLDEGRRNARDLAPTVAKLLAGQGWKPADLAGVIVSRGPGSYTGLRVGLMSAMTLAYATGCALLTVETFAAIAEQAPEGVCRLDVLADAQQDKVYFQPFSREAEGWRALGEVRIVRFADWLAGRDAEAVVTGPGLVKWEAHLPSEVLRLAVETRTPGAASLLKLGLARYRAGQRDEVFGVEPLYLRASSAEEQWRKKP